MPFRDIYPRKSNVSIFDDFGFLSVNIADPSVRLYYREEEDAIVFGIDRSFYSCIGERIDPVATVAESPYAVIEEVRIHRPELNFVKVVYSGRRKAHFYLPVAVLIIIAEIEIVISYIRYALIAPAVFCYL